MINLSKFDNSWYYPGHGLLVRITWYFFNAIFFLNPLNISSNLKIVLLKLFGARIGKGVILKPRINVKYPWNLEIGNNSWIGENVWLDSLAHIKIGNNVCISQGVYLCTGNHNWTDPAFGLIVKPITIKDGTWIATGAIVLPGVTISSHSILTAGSVISKDTEPYMIYSGNPAVPVKGEKFVKYNLNNNSKRNLLKKYLSLAGIAFTAIVLILEVFSRFVLGLGDPPLSMPHPTIEYLFQPNQKCKRFGNIVSFNSYSMRSDKFEKHKINKEEFRVMIFGDSVINGGNLTDQSELATTILQNKLSQIVNRPVVVGNISAGSWGLPNLLAYAMEFGFFDADIVIIILNSEDYADIPTFEPLNPDTHPENKPFLAVVEGITRYLPRYLPRFGSHQYPEVSINSATPSESSIDQCLSSLKELLILAKSSGGEVMVFQHWDREEVISSKPKIGHDLIYKVCKDNGVRITQLESVFRERIAEEQNPFRDNIHPNPLGQELIAKAILHEIQNDLTQNDENPTSLK